MCICTNLNIYIHVHTDIDTDTDIDSHTYAHTHSKALKATHGEISILDGHVAEEDLPAFVRLGRGSVGFNYDGWGLGSIGFGV